MHQPRFQGTNLKLNSPRRVARKPCGTFLGPRVRWNGVSRRVRPGLLVAFVAALLVACAAALPSPPRGTSQVHAPDELALVRRVGIDAPLVSVHDPVGEALTAGLPALGFELADRDPDAIVRADLAYSDYSPVRLRLVIEAAGTGQVVWSAEVTRAWDLHTSVVSAAERNTRKALELLRQDLAAGAGRPP